MSGYGAIHHQAHQMQRTRQRLAVSRSQRQRAVAEFPLRIAGVAYELKNLCDLRDRGCEFNNDAMEAMQHLEDQIRNCYREMFGTELGQ